LKECIKVDINLGKDGRILIASDIICWGYLWY